MSNVLHTSQQKIVITPKECDRIQWDGLKYIVTIDLDPESLDDDLDFPIRLTDTSGSDTAVDLELEVDDAEMIGHALIQAAQIRRDAIRMAKGDK